MMLNPNVLSSLKGASVAKLGASALVAPLVTLTLLGGVALWQSLRTVKKGKSEIAGNATINKELETLNARNTKLESQLSELSEQMSNQNAAELSSSQENSGRSSNIYGPNIYGIRSDQPSRRRREMLKQVVDENLKLRQQP